MGFAPRARDPLVLTHANDLAAVTQGKGRIP